MRLPLRLATAAMGTRFELVLVGEREPALRAAGEAAIAEIEDCEQRLSRFRPDSLLAQVHRRAPHDWVPLDADTFALLATCDRVHRASAGAFDPTVAPLMDALGFFGATGDVAAAQRAVGWDAVELDEERRAVRFNRPDLRLDFGAIGKGQALDRAGAALREAGVEGALLHAGTSTVLALGAPPDLRGWRVAIAGGEPPPVATLRDAALSVSAPHGRTTNHAGAPIGHVLDPRSGRPASGLALAAVIAPEATLADAWSTALLVGGSELAARTGLEALLRGEGEGAAWHHHAPACIAISASR